MIELASIPLPVVLAVSLMIITQLATSDYPLDEKRLKELEERRKKANKDC